MNTIYYECKSCNYFTKKKYNYNKHLTTYKHLKNIDILNEDSIKDNNISDNNISDNNISDNNITDNNITDINITDNNITDINITDNNICNIKKFICICGKSYRHRQSLSLHKKSCFIESFSNVKVNNVDDNCYNNLKIITNNKSDLHNKLEITENKSDTINTENIKDMFIKLIDENKELQKIIIEQSRQITELIPKIGNTTHNNIKQRFNINMFLNEKCKDALNITEFVESIEISLQQLDLTKSEGLTKGLSNAIIENINKLSIYERPLHCTDIKRETLYVKDDNVWEKDKEQSKIKKVIKDISIKQFKTLGEWKEKNPDLMYDEEKQDYFSHAIYNIGTDTSKVNNKVIKNICANIYIKDDE